MMLEGPPRCDVRPKSGQPPAEFAPIARQLCKDMLPAWRDLRDSELTVGADQENPYVSAQHSQSTKRSWISQIKSFLQVSALTGGISNSLYKVIALRKLEAGPDTLVVRVYADYPVTTHVDREREQQVLISLNSIGFGAKVSSCKHPPLLSIMTSLAYHRHECNGCLDIIMHAVHPCTARRSVPINFLKISCCNQHYHARNMSLDGQVQCVNKTLAQNESHPTHSRLRCQCFTDANLRCRTLASQCAQQRDTPGIIRPLATKLRAVISHMPCMFKIYRTPTDAW